MVDTERTRRGITFHRRRGWSLFLSLALVAASALAFSLGGQRGATVEDVLRRSSIAGRDLRVGVLADQPLLSEVEPDGRRTGFDVELAAALARSLGVAPVFVPLAPPERLSALTEGRVDVVFAALLMTTERRRLIDFAGPYLQGGLVALARRTWSGRVSGSRFCTVAGTTADLTLTSRPAVVQRRDNPLDCLADVRSGRVDAFAGDEVLLRGGAYASGGALRIFPLGGALPVQRYGIGVAWGDRHLRALVDSFLLASYAKGEAGAWQQAMNHTLARAGYLNRQPQPEGTLLRGAGDGQETVSAVSGVPPAVAPPASTPARQRRTLRHRARRHSGRRRRRVTERPMAASPEAPAGTGPTDRSQFWSLLLGVPVAVSALYLWIQSGGDRQFTLMLADSVNPITFLATVSLSVVWIFFAVPAVVLTVGAVVLGSAADPADRRLLSRRYAVARWTARAPGWLVGASVLAAAVSTPLVFLPVWGLALHLATRHRTAPRVRPLVGLLLAGVAAAIAWAALGQDEPVLAAVAGWPAPVLLLGVDAAVRRSDVARFVRASGTLAALLAIGVLYTVVTTPILPSTAIQVSRPQAPVGAPAPHSTTTRVADPDAGSETTSVRQLRGYVVSVDEESTTILSDAGGVEIVPNADILSRTSCPSFTDLPGDSATVLGLPLRESLLKALARRQRPATFQDPRCVIQVDAAAPPYAPDPSQTTTWTTKAWSSQVRVMVTNPTFPFDVRRQKSPPGDAAG
ncbi:substrate-binding periplasmic protein [Micromonospora sp. NPDC002575]|uniref:substrate-binding periplasmic protein n=1 Tax=Micromonospora sp. NPDC002575 TaxID=3364222 RepID=UPI0036A6B5C6